MSLSGRVSPALTGILRVSIGSAVLASVALAGFDVLPDSFLLARQRLQIRSGEIHYCRVPRAEWDSRITMARAMGLNTISTYVFWNLHERSWNLHERRPGGVDFGSELDLVSFLSTCREAGMHAIVRPGPYVCAEWDLGGIPGWVLAEPDVRLRSADPRLLEPAKRWMRKVGELLAPLSVERGGPVLMVQLENEYGAYGADGGYTSRHHYFGFLECGRYSQ